MMVIRVETGFGKKKRKKEKENWLKSRCAMCPVCERRGERGRGREGRGEI